MAQIVEQAPTWGSSLGTGLGQGLGAGLSKGFEQLLNHKLENKQYQQQQLRQQQETSRMSKVFEQNGIKPQQAAHLAELFIRDPKAAEDAYAKLGGLGLSEEQRLAREKVALQGELGRGELKVKEGELTHKTGFDAKEFERKDKELELERKRDLATLAHTAHTEGMDKQNYALKAKQIDQDYKNKREALNVEREKIKAMAGENSMAERKENYNEGKKFSDAISIDVHNAVEKKKEATKALAYLNTGKVFTGLIEGNVPLGLTNEESRKFDKAVANLVAAKSREGGGVMSKAKMILTERGKVNANMQEAAIRELLEGEIKDADELGIGMGKIRDEIKTANGGTYPRDIEGKVFAEHQRRYPEYYKEYDKYAFNTPQAQQQPQQQQTQQQPQEQQQPTRRQAGGKIFNNIAEAPASKYPKKSMQSEDTGKWYRSNGITWIEE